MKQMRRTLLRAQAARGNVRPVRCFTRTVEPLPLAGRLTTAAPTGYSAGATIALATFSSAAVRIIAALADRKAPHRFARDRRAGGTPDGWVPRLLLRNPLPPAPAAWIRRTRRGRPTAPNHATQMRRRREPARPNKFLRERAPVPRLRAARRPGVPPPRRHHRRARRQRPREFPQGTGAPLSILCPEVQKANYVAVQR